MSLETAFPIAVPPFKDTPDPELVFLTPNHEALLAELVNFVQNRRGLALLVGEEGVGKTTLLLTLMGRLPPTCQDVLVSHPSREPLGLVQMLASSLGLALGERECLEVTALAQELRSLVQAGRQPVVMVDEAQELSDGHLKELWLLAQMENQDGGLLPFILVGRRGLLKKLESRTHERLRPLIRARLTLPPLTPRETILYLDHRLRRAGSSFAACFSPECSGPLFAITGGLPRRINRLAREALERAQREGLPRVTRSLLSGEEASPVPVDLGPLRPRAAWRNKLTAAAVLLGLGLISALYLGGLGFLRPFTFTGPALKSPAGISGKEGTRQSPAGTPLRPGETPETSQAEKPKPSPLSAGTVRPSGSGELPGAVPSPSREQVASEATYQVAPADYLYKIAARFYRENPKIGFAALLLANPGLNETDPLFPGQILNLPQVDQQSGIIRIKDRYFYLLRRYFGETPEMSRLVQHLKENQVEFLIRESRHPEQQKIYRLFLGGYASVPELHQVIKQFEEPRP
jgi:general secretion pathway protein A